MKVVIYVIWFILAIVSSVFSASVYIKLTSHDIDLLHIMYGLYHGFFIALGFFVFALFLQKYIKNLFFFFLIGAILIPLISYTVASVDNYCSLGYIILGDTKIKID